MRADGYLDVDRSGVDWLLDPDSPQLRLLGKEISERTPASSCDPAGVLDDLGLLRVLLRERHMGIAVGRSSAFDVEDVVEAWTRRVHDRRPVTWDAAVGDAVIQLQEALGDRRTQVLHTSSRPVPRPSQAPDAGPVWEARDVRSGRAAARVVRVRALTDAASASRDVAAAVAAADADFAFERIVVDLRGAMGGDDGPVRSWAEGRAAAPWPAVRGGSRWAVGPGRTALNVWNYLVFEAVTRPDRAAAALGAQEHQPRPDDTLHLVFDEPVDAPAGPQPWAGRMLVLVDGATASAGESSALLLRDCLGARLVGGRTYGVVEYGAWAPYVLPASGLVVTLPTEWSEVAEPTDVVGIAPDLEIDVTMAVDDVARAFDDLWAAAA